MKHVRYCETWPEIEGEPATGRQLLALWDMRPLGEHPDGGWLFDCLGRDVHEGMLTDDLPGIRLRGGAGSARYRRLPDDCKAICYHQEVYRHPESGDVRGAAHVHAERDPGPPARSPRGRGRRPEFDHAEPDDEDLLRGAEREARKGRAVRRAVCACEVEETDVVASPPRPGSTWSGEPPPDDDVGRVRNGVGR